MAENSGQERTEQATGKRRLEARKRGQVAMSREIPSAFILLTVLAVFHFAGPGVFDRCQTLLSGIFRDLHSLRMATVADAGTLAVELFQTVIMLLVPIFLPLLVVGFLANVAQIGFEVHAEAMAPKFAKLNPFSGIKRLVSLRSLVELVKSVLKLLFVGGIAYAVVSGFLEDFPALVRYDLSALWRFLHQAAFKIIFYVCLAMILLAALDYIYQRWQHEQSLKMTKQEVKDDRKQSEGDPAVKARIRSLQRQAAYHRMMAEVPTADVVITNPTHLAVALKFRPEEMPAPKVVAIGADYIAERIRESARAHGVPVVENKPLAQALYKMTGLGDYVPVDLYRAVAEVLAYVYRLKGKLSL